MTEHDQSKNGGKSYLRLQGNVFMLEKLAGESACILKAILYCIKHVFKDTPADKEYRDTNPRVGIHYLKIIKGEVDFLGNKLDDLVKEIEKRRRVNHAKSH